MKVKTLIKRLEKVPQNLYVRFEFDHCLDPTKILVYKGKDFFDKDCVWIIKGNCGT